MLSTNNHTNTPARAHVLKLIHTYSCQFSCQLTKRESFAASVGIVFVPGLVAQHPAPAKVCGFNHGSGPEMLGVCAASGSVLHDSIVIVNFRVVSFPRLVPCLDPFHATIGHVYGRSCCMCWARRCRRCWCGRFWTFGRRRGKHAGRRRGCNDCVCGASFFWIHCGGAGNQIASSLAKHTFLKAAWRSLKDVRISVIGTTRNTFPVGIFLVVVSLQQWICPFVPVFFIPDRFISSNIWSCCSNPVAVPIVVQKSHRKSMVAVIIISKMEEPDRAGWVCVSEWEKREKREKNWKVLQ